MCKYSQLCCILVKLLEESRNILPVSSKAYDDEDSEANDTLDCTQEDIDCTLDNNLDCTQEDLDCALANLDCTLDDDVSDTDSYSSSTPNSQIKLKIQLQPYGNRYERSPMW